MAKKSGNDRQRVAGATAGGSDREARLKAALKANLARRKAQARRRAVGKDAGTDETPR